MLVTFLGTGAGVPTRLRNVTSIALRLTQSSETWLFDCGEGTQQQMLRSTVRPARITRIFISHMHGDHVFGLPGLLASCSLAGDCGPIALHGPARLEEFVRTAVTLTDTRLSFAMTFHPLEAGPVIDVEGVSVECARLEHRTESFGFRVTEAGRAGSFDVERARALGVPSGPLFGRLKAGEVVHLEDGRTIDGRDLVGPSRRGPSLAICLDTAPCDAAVTLARDVDLLVHDATFSAEYRDLAAQSGHSTAEDAAAVAREAGAARLLLTHLSARYAPGNAITPIDLLGEARGVFPNTEVAEDFMEVAVGA